MAKITNRSRIYGLTLRQWAVITIVIFSAIIFGCRFCYNTINERVASPETNEPANTKSNSNRRGNPKNSPNPNAPAVPNLTVEQARQVYFMLGNPSNANESDDDNFLMVKPQFALSYNRTRRTANWVAWKIRNESLGPIERANDFRPDTSLPDRFSKVRSSDYDRSGFDRGHICPSADWTNTAENNSATFLMSNIVPQTPDLNQGAWKRLEDYSRDIVRKGNDVHVFAGVYGDAGKVKDKVTIPTNCWKVVVVLPEGFDKLSEIDANTQIIAVDMPNINGIKNDDWRKYQTTIRQIEQKTKLNLLSTLPAEIQNALKNKQEAK